MLPGLAGPYREAFETDNVTVAVVCLDSNRVAQLIDWTMRELTIRSAQEYAELFLFTSGFSSRERRSASFWIRCGIRPTQGKLFRSWIFRSETSESGVVFQTRMSLWDSGPTIPLGKTRFLWLFTRTLRISRRHARAHMHVLGKTGSGKSYFLAGLFLAFYEAGMPVTLIDPHGDLAELVLSHLAAAGVFRDGKAYERLVYLDLPAAAAQGRYLPFNYLEQPYDDHAMAELVAEACRRAWPELATGAPTFENILKHSVIALRQNRPPADRARQPPHR